MRIGPLGLPEIIIIVVIIAVLFGPSLFTKLGKRIKQTGDAAKKGIEAGAAEAGKDVDLDSAKKGSVMETIDSFQDKLDEKLTEAEEELESEEHKEKAKQRAKTVTDAVTSTAKQAVEGLEDEDGEEAETQQ